MRKIVLIATLALLSACSSTQQQPETATSRNPDIIAADELAAPDIQAGDLLQAIQRPRPRLLRVHGQFSSTTPTAGQVLTSVDGAPLLPVNTLKTLRPSSVREVKYLSSTDAAQRFGTAAGMGSVILVTSR